MRAIICIILTVITSCAGIVLSIIERTPLICFGFIIGGLISYELAIIIKNQHK